MSLNFSEPKSINLNNVKKIYVETIDGKPFRIITKKCDSFGVKKSEKFNSKSISIILDEDSAIEMKRIIKVCEEHLKTSLSKILYERKDGSVTLYPKIREFDQFKSVVYDERGRHRSYEF